MIIYDDIIVNNVSIPVGTFGTFPNHPVKIKCPPVKQKLNKKQEVENTMYIDKTLPIENQQKTYLNERVRTVFYDLQHKLCDQFFINDDQAPLTLKDFKDRVANGKFTVTNFDGEKIDSNDWDDEEDKVCWNIIHAIRWRDPAKKADIVGKEAADKELSKKFTETKDQIMIGTPADGLKALQELEAWVPSNLPS
jgi:hypothetical protein